MRRLLVGVSIVLVLVAGGAVLGVNALLNTTAARERIVAAIERATGHAATLDGPVRVRWSLRPLISAGPLTLLNGPGFSRPELARAKRIEGGVALLPLLRGRVVIPSVTIDGLDVLLERDAGGRGNWSRPPAPAGAPAGALQPRRPVEIGLVTVNEGRVAWLETPPVLVQSLSAEPSGGTVSGTVVVADEPLAIQGKVDLSGPDPAFLVGAQGAGIALYASAGPGPSVVFDATVDDLARWDVALGRSLPPLHGVLLHARVGQAGASELKMYANDSDLGSFVPGLHISKMRATSDGIGQPIQIGGEGALNALPLELRLTVAALGPAPWAVQGSLDGDGATLGLDGVLNPGSLSGAVSVRVPDVQRTAALAGVALPAVHEAALDLRVLPAPSGAGLILRGLRLTSREADLAGDFAVSATPLPSLAGTFTSQHWDLDVLAARPDTAVPPGTEPPPNAATPAAAPSPPLAPAPEEHRTVIPDRPLPFAALRRADLDVTGSVGQLTYGGSAYAVRGLRVLLHEGQLRLGPDVVMAPGGPLQVAVQADGGAQPPTVGILLHGSGLDAAGLAAAVGTPGAITGQVDADVDLTLAGGTAHALAASASGHVALALSDGDIDNRLLGALFGTALRGAGVPLEAAGRSRVRCLALRSEVALGQASLQVLTLDAARLRVEGEGKLDLGAETMDLHLRPELRIGPLPVKVPVQLTGPWRAPHAQPDKGVVSAGRFGLSIGSASPDPCGPALAAVRQGLAR